MAAKQSGHKAVHREDGGGMNARADLCMLIAEYVPTSFHPETMTALGQVEEVNGLAKGTLREARWIKQRKWWKDGQRSAHLILGCMHPSQANVAIRKGLVIEGKQVYLRRHCIGPHRCMKCQQVGTAHRTAVCKAVHDTCGQPLQDSTGRRCAR